METEGEYKMIDCYIMAERLLGKSFDDPLKLVCLAELLFKWKYTKRNLWETREQYSRRQGTSLEGKI